MSVNKGWFSIRGGVHILKHCAVGSNKCWDLFICSSWWSRAFKISVLSSSEKADDGSAGYKNEGILQAPKLHSKTHYDSRWCLNGVISERYGRRYKVTMGYSGYFVVICFSICFCESFLRHTQTDGFSLYVSMPFFIWHLGISLS